MKRWNLGPGFVIGAILLGSCLCGTSQAQVFNAGQGSSFTPAANSVSASNNEVNAEWVESSSPTPNGGRITTTKFPGSEQLITKVTDPMANPLNAASQRPQLATQSGLVQTNLAGGVVPAVN